MLGSILVPTWRHFPFPTQKKYTKHGTPRRIDFLDRIWQRFLYDSGSILGPKLVSCWPLVTHKSNPRPAKKAKKVIRTFKRAWDASWIPPGPSRPRFLVPSDLDFRRIFDRCLGARGHWFYFNFSLFFTDFEIVSHQFFKEIKKPRSLTHLKFVFEQRLICNRVHVIRVKIYTLHDSSMSIDRYNAKKCSRTINRPYGVGA